MEAWRKVGIVSACGAMLLLALEHFLPHGCDLNGVDHWLSEYVLSQCVPAQLLMRLAFLALAASAVAVAALSKKRILRMLFGVSAMGLAAMTFLDTYPNDGRQRPHWPPTAGNLHQDMLYVAIGAALIGIGISLPRSRHRGFDAALLGVALLSTAVQTWLVAKSEMLHQMTRYGGITERIVVVTMLVWVVGFCAQTEKGKGVSQPKRRPATK